MNDELKELKAEYEQSLNTRHVGPLSKACAAHRYVMALEEEVEMLEDLFETNVAELEEMNKTQAEDIRKMIKEKNEKPLTNIQQAGRFIGRLRRRG